MSEKGHEISRRTFVELGAGAAAGAAIRVKWSPLTSKRSANAFIVGTKERVTDHAQCCRMVGMTIVGSERVTMKSIENRVSRQQLIARLSAAEVDLIVIVAPIETRTEVLKIAAETGKAIIVELPLPVLTLVPASARVQACMPRRVSGADESAIRHLRVAAGTIRRVDIGVLITRNDASTGLLVAPTEVWLGLTEELDFCRRLLDVEFPATVSAHDAVGPGGIDHDSTRWTRIEAVYLSTTPSRRCSVTMTITELIPRSSASESPAELTVISHRSSREPRSLRAAQTVTATSLRVIGSKGSVATTGIGFDSPALGHAPAERLAVYDNLRMVLDGRDSMKGAFSDVLPSYAVLHVASAALRQRRTVHLDPYSGAIQNDPAPPTVDSLVDAGVDVGRNFDRAESIPYPNIPFDTRGCDEATRALPILPESIRYAPERPRSVPP